MKCSEIIKSFPRYISYSLLSRNSLISVKNQESSTYIEEYPTTKCYFLSTDLTKQQTSVFAFVVPTLALFGLCANFINFVVFMRPKMTSSAFTYLATLSWLDLLSCLLIILTSFSRSILEESSFWQAFDFQWQTPLLSITMGAANLILACVSLDRFIYLHWAIPNGTPKFCRRIVARSIIIAMITLSILLNLPYFWVFKVNDDGTYEVTEFFFHNYYLIYNWLTFILLTLLPAIFLLLGNTAILIAFCKWSKQTKKCQISCPNPNNKISQNRYKHQMKLTITIVIIVTLYLVGDLPAELTSRKCFVSLLYAGDIKKVDVKYMQLVEVICITLNVLHLSINIIIYALINPCFGRELFSCIREALNACIRFMSIMSVARGCEKCYKFVDRKKFKYVSKGISGVNCVPRRLNTPQQQLQISVICTRITNLNGL